MIVRSENSVFEIMQFLLLLHIIYIASSPGYIHFLHATLKSGFCLGTRLYTHTPDNHAIYIIVDNI